MKLESLLQANLLQIVIPLPVSIPSYYFIIIRSQRSFRMLEDHKHDTHLFTEVNQAIIVWSNRQD